MIQVAESIVRIKGTREVVKSNLEQPIIFMQQKPAKDDSSRTLTQYLVSFDKALNLKDVWITAKMLDCFNQLRQDMSNKQVKPRFSSDDNILSETHNNNSLHEKEGISEEDIQIEYIKKSERLRGFNMDQLDFCHHCMQLKQTQIHVRCRYQSTKQRVNYPNAMHINGLKVYNADMSQQNLVNILILKRLVTDTKRR